MVRLVTTVSLLLAAGAIMSATTAQAYIGEGVQGRPHGGHTPQRMLYRRHGLPIPYRFRRHHHTYRAY